MSQYEYNQLLNNLSWEKAGQTIVNTAGKLLNVGIIILHFKKLQPDSEQHFFHRHLSLDTSNLSQDLLKLTVASDSELSINNNLIIQKYTAEVSTSKSSSYQACLQAKISSSIYIRIFSHPNLTASLTVHRCQESEDWHEEEIKAVKMVATQATLIISQMLAGEKLKELAQRETTINRITATIRSSLEPPSHVCHHC